MTAPDPNTTSRRKLLAWGAALGFFYALALRLLPALHLVRDGYVMTLSFIGLMPIAVGFITIFIAEKRQRQSMMTWAFLPWVPMAGALLATLVVALEGAICIVMLAPLALLLSSLGGMCGGVAGRLIASRRSRSLSLACVVVLPVLVGPWEPFALEQRELRSVENVIEIQAPPEVIWRNIERVPAIHREELPVTWTRRIGFPDPVEATLSHEGVGGVRNASFQGGIVFIETVDFWEPEQRLGFSIRAGEIPRTTLDEHVTIGGPYFDVLHGEYRLEALPDGNTRLHLRSEQRLSTDFNWYAHLWTEAVMSDLQQRILQVIKARCENELSRRRP